MERDKIIFIVGMYKCGTSWLLSSLASHKDCAGLREIDLLRNVYLYKAGILKAKKPKERVISFFGSNAWCPFFGKEVQDSMRKSLSKNGEKGIASAQRILEESLNEQSKMSNRNDTYSRPMTIRDMPIESAMELMRSIYCAKRPLEACDAFLEYISSSVPKNYNVVIKAADQLPLFNTLDKWKPHAHKIAIIRDGRDAIISALHYRRLMQKKQAPWAGKTLSITDLMRGWKSRANMLAKLTRQKKVYVVRYEDLSFRFAETFRRLLETLALESDAGIISDIENKTSFEAMTGRKRGEAADSVIRKGMVGEWVDELDENDKKKCWYSAGKTLEIFGYTSNGTITDSDLVL